MLLLWHLSLTWCVIDGWSRGYLVRGNGGTPMEDILAFVLGFFICYDLVFNYHPTLFDSLVVTYWGEIKFFSTKLVNKVKVDDKESKQNIRDLISGLIQ